MSRHEGVSCDNCLTSNFREIRFKCLICYDYDLCESCYNNNVSTSRHSPSHPMQCILTKHDFDLYYGGEGISMDNPPSLTCPLCGKRGLTEGNLQEHVNAQHLENSVEVVCPICAAIPSGDPNHVTDDFATHLAIEHNNTHRGIEDPIGGRHMRRMFYPGRSIRGARAQRSANMNFTSSPNTVPGFSNVANTAAASVPQIRDAMDPIAELLSQLSGVRSNAQRLQQTVSTASQLQELQAQLQLERQRASIIRQQLERFPGKIQTAQNGNQVTTQASGNQSKTYANAIKAGKTETTPTTSEDDDPRLLLSKIYEPDSNEGDESQNIDIFEQSLFVQELILSLPTDEDTDYTDVTPVSQQSSAPARAIPVDCGVLTASPSQQRALTNGGDKSIFSQCTSSASTTEAGRSTDRVGQTDQTHHTGTGRQMRDSDQLQHGMEVLWETKKGEDEHKPLLHHSSEPISEMKKDSGARGSTLRQPQFSSGAGTVAGRVCPQSGRPVSTFPVLVSGASEQ